MIELMKAEKYRLFCRFDNIGVVIISSVLTLLSSLAVELLNNIESMDSVSQNLMANALQNSGGIMVIFAIITEIYIIGPYIQNKIVNYELMIGYTFEQIWLTKMIMVSGIISGIFSVITFIFLKVNNLIANEQLILNEEIRCIFLFMVIFHLSCIAIVYIYILQNAFLTIGCFVIIQLFTIPSIINFIDTLELVKFEYGDMMIQNQVKLIWTENMPEHIPAIVMFSMLIEVVVVYILAKVYVMWKGRSLYV